MDDPEMGLGKDGARTRTWMSPGAGGGWAPGLSSGDRWERTGRVTGMIRSVSRCEPA